MRNNAYVISLSILTLALLLGPAAYGATQDDGGPFFSLRGFFASGLEKITTAVSHLRSVVGPGADITSLVERVRQEREARRAVVASIVEFILEENSQAQTQLAALSSLDPELRSSLGGYLTENKMWFSSIRGSIGDARVISQIQTIAQDVSQYRDTRHRAIVRLISSLNLAARQGHLLALVRQRMDRIESDLDAVEREGRDVSALRAEFQTAQEYVEQAGTAFAQAQELLSNITPPFETDRYAADIDTAQNLLSNVNLLIREAYEIFLHMADSAQELE